MGERGELRPDALLGGKIRLIRRIGRGGMGDVWVARNEATHAEVAVKTLQKSERTKVHDERFKREARLAATISHRNVVRIFDLIDDSDGTLGLVMELLRGGTLEDYMRERGPMPALEALAIAIPILSALHHVHQKGIVHRDVKPANIFFAVEPDGHVIPKILDFGIAKLPAAGSALTLDGSVLGTPHYMSPEQIRGQDDMDGRSDMFSLAVVLYEMLTGDRVFQRDSAAASLASVLEHEVEASSRIGLALWAVLSRALKKRPYERYATCGELADALRAATSSSDEDLAQALQSLKPTAAGANVSESSDPKPSTFDVVPKPAPLGWIVAGAMGMVALVTGLVVALSAPGGPGGRAVKAPAAGSTPPGSAHAMATASTTQSEASALPPIPSVTMPSADVVAAPETPAPETPAPAGAHVAAPGKPSPTKIRAGGGGSHPAGTGKSTKPSGTKPVATSFD